MDEGYTILLLLTKKKYQAPDGLEGPTNKKVAKSLL